jgi:hypothetical protein
LLTEKPKRLPRSFSGHHRGKCGPEKRRRERRGDSINELPLFLFCDTGKTGTFGRNGGAMGKSDLEKKKSEKKNKVVKMPRRDGGKDAVERANGKRKAGEKKPKSRKKPTKKIEKEEHKGARKALRHAVQREVKENCGKIAERLVNDTQNGDIRSTEMVLSLMEKKKKDGDEDDDGQDGPSLAEQLAAGPSWDEVQEARRKAREKETETEAA